MKTRNKLLIRLLIQAGLFALLGFFFGHFFLKSIAPETEAPLESKKEPLIQKETNPQKSFTQQTSLKPKNPITVLDQKASTLLTYLEQTASFTNRDFAQAYATAEFNRFFQQAILKEWARRHPRAMFETFLKDPTLTKHEKRSFYETALNEWVRQDPESAIAHLEIIPETTNSAPHLALHNALKNEGLFALVLDLEKKSIMTWWGWTDPGKFLTWTRNNPTEALEKILNVRMPGLRHQYLKLLGSDHSPENHETAFERASQLNRQDQRAWLTGFISTLSKNSSPEALHLLTEKIKDPVVLGAVSPFIRRWFTEDAPAAITWVDHHLVGKDRSEIISSAIQQTAQKDWEQASTLAGSLPSGPAKNIAYQTLLRQRISSTSGAKGLSDWILSINDAEALQSSLDQEYYMLVSNQFATARFLAEQDDPTVARKQLILAVASRMREDDHLGTEKWISSLPERNRLIAEGGW